MFFLAQALLICSITSPGLISTSLDWRKASCLLLGPCETSSKLSETTVRIPMPLYLCLPPPPSIMGEEYCFPRRQLIFSFGMRVIYHSKGL